MDNNNIREEMNAENEEHGMNNGLNVNEEQIRRIGEMESRLDSIRDALDALSDAFTRYESAEDDYFALVNYYGSPEWWKDFEDDEAGRIPKDLKRGVLSEDAVYDLMTEQRELTLRMQRAVLRTMEKEK